MIKLTIATILTAAVVMANTPAPKTETPKTPVTEKDKQIQELEKQNKILKEENQVTKDYGDFKILNTQIENLYELDKKRKRIQDELGVLSTDKGCDPKLGINVETLQCNPEPKKEPEKK